MQSQEGVLKTPYHYSLIQKYVFEDLPLIAMNVARIGAQTPGMAYEIAKGEKHFATIGFGPMTWLLITPDIPAQGGFRAFDEMDIGDKEIPESEGDMLFYFSSGQPELNRELAGRVGELFGKDGELIFHYGVKSITKSTSFVKNIHENKAREEKVTGYSFKNAFKKYGMTNSSMTK